jgi:hypothetical protein
MIKIYVFPKIVLLASFFFFSNSGFSQKHIESEETIYQLKKALSVHLGAVSTVNAVQINYADQDVTFLGKTIGEYHQYLLYYSVDVKKWNL